MEGGTNNVVELAADVTKPGHEWEKLHHANEYEKPYFFVSQLFQRDWKPQEWVY